ncbi:heat-inducible transcriptional repressor [Methylomarinovum tepidoasis]|uniref:Heat-inducible transcription repressor HrcA n=1 Tax=Methylomarinovum tepidoasis TaxID=2840183 RepID=A0AAU9CQH7_9GAMM|nr:heat-inducible transcriptional repressor HrcA [Methylomarinovum sp. IN45]BCX88608.1 heat-inducible transcriptional repressor [Methylomarinovum sp. IN45]
MTQSLELTDRAQHLLKVLIERYIEEGQPVGSRALAREAGLNLSPATVRNVMADLEEMGLVTSPHTSAGRVPTVKGYRLFVDALLTVQPPEQALIQRLWDDFEVLEDPQELLETASQLLARITRMAGLVTLPQRQRLAFQHIEFLPLSGGRILVVLVTDDQEIHNRIIRPQVSLTPSQLQEAANYLNSLLRGRRLSEVRETLVAEMRAAGEQLRQLIEMTQTLFSGEAMEEDFVLAGQTNLMEFNELAERERLRSLFEVFEEKRNLIHLLDQCIQAEGVQIFIGEESGYRPLESCSLVARHYDVGERALGVIGVIGPTRMHYERVIPLVDVTAKLLGSALNQKLSAPS